MFPHLYICNSKKGSHAISIGQSVARTKASLILFLLGGGLAVVKLCQKGDEGQSLERPERDARKSWEPFCRWIQNIGVTGQLVSLPYLMNTCVRAVQIFEEREWEWAGTGAPRFCFLQLLWFYITHTAISRTVGEPVPKVRYGLESGLN